MARYYLLEFLALQITSAALAMPVSHGASTDTRQDENSTGAAGQRAANEPDLKLWALIKTKCRIRAHDCFFTATTLWCNDDD